MVNIVFTILSLAILVVAVATRGNTTPLSNAADTTQVLSATTEESPTPNPTVEPTQTPLPTLFPTNTPVVTATPWPTPTSAPVSFGESINAWLYTGALSDKSISDASLSFTTRDSAKTVTQWYKEKMTTLNYNSKSVIQTQSNEKVLDKLSGSGTHGSVAIEITQDHATDPVHVTVTLDESSVNKDINVSVNNSI